jgi:hypothetical protein
MSGDSKIISLNAFTPAPDYVACKELEAYWDALRGVRQMPKRSEFDPRGIETALSFTFVAEKVAPSVARIRVAGSKLADLLGMEVRGMPVTAFFDPDSRDVLSEAVARMFKDPARLVVELESKRGFGRRSLKARMVMFPMSDSEGEVTRIVGCLEVHGHEGRMPRRFNAVKVYCAKLIGDTPESDMPSVAPQRPMAVTPTPVQEPSYGFAEPKPEYAAKRSGGKDAAKAAPVKRGHLTLVVSND